MLRSLSNGPGVYLSPSRSGVDHISSAWRWPVLPIHQRPGEASMLRKKAEIFSVVTWVVILGCLASSAFAARKEKVLYSFCSEQSCNGFQGPSNLILDAAGNFYGTTIYGGTTNNGAVFQLTHGADGTWSQNVLYSFCSLPKCSDGSSPSSGLIFDAAGNLYGATDGVGTSLSAVVYQLAPSANGTWTERVL